MNLRRVLIPGCDTGAAILDKVALVCFGIVLLASGEARAETLVGALPGEFAVDNKGAANYSVPISVVPGRGGFQPTLSLAYNSLQGNGVAGVGWSLSYGASKITRGRTIMARDGYVDGMDFDDADRLYLDGKRLIQTNAGSYWHVGAEYRTEVESFVRVTALGANGATNGAGAIEGFKVESKDGSILYFGKVDSSSSDALHILKGNSSPYGWAIKYLQNSVGDRITYFYNPYRDSAGELTGEHQLARIEYSSNAFLGINASARVRLLYTPDDVVGSQERSDVFSGYMGGAHYEGRRRLAEIEASVRIGSEWVAVRRYILHYIISTGSKRSLLTQVELRARKDAAADWDVMPPTVLNYDSETVSGIALTDPVWSSISDLSGAVSDSEYRLMAGSGDFNGKRPAGDLVVGL